MDRGRGYKKVYILYRTCICIYTLCGISSQINYGLVVYQKYTYLNCTDRKIHKKAESFDVCDKWFFIEQYFVCSRSGLWFGVPNIIRTA